MSWDTVFLGIIAFSSLLLVLAALAVAVGLFRALKQLNVSMEVVEKEAVKALREVQATAKGVSDFSSTAKRFTEETFLSLVTRRMSKPAGGKAAPGAGGVRKLLFAGLGLGVRMLRSCLKRRRTKPQPADEQEQ